MNISFTRTIKFKLTLWYSLLVFLLGLVFVFALNIYVASQLQADPIFNSDFVEREARRPSERFQELAEEERERIQEVRFNDLLTIRKASLLALIPLALVSFGGGYILSGSMLNPLGRLNKKIRKLQADNLRDKIDHDGPDDEVGELITSFNDMSERLHQAFESQARFVADASHELKTPFAIIQTNLDTILSDKKASREELIKAIQNALVGVENVNKLVEDLLSLSLQEGALIENVDLNKLISAVLADFEQVAEKKGVKLQFIRSKGKIVINGSEFSLSRAISNVVDNGIKYSKKGGSVSVGVSKGSDRGSEVLISIVDTGPGIPAKDLSKIFDRFYRVDKARTRKEGGFGLGLSLVKKIIEEHGGRVEVQSEVGKGTEFKVYLPT
ncbi:MAG TPA: HAMP domain-containing histidine kinase [bacterium]|nr:HAMP domain-containing histidine kinase [bacterium]